MRKRRRGEHEEERILHTKQRFLHLRTKIYNLKSCCLREYQLCSKLNFASCGENLNENSDVIQWKCEKEKGKIVKLQETLPALDKTENLIEAKTNDKF